MLFSSPCFCFSFSLTLTWSPSGMYGHRFYKAILNNRSSASCNRRTRLWGNMHTHKCMYANTQRERGTVLEGSNLLVPSPSSAVSFVVFTGLYLKVTDSTAFNRGTARLCCSHIVVWRNAMQKAASVADSIQGR